MNNRLLITLIAALLIAPFTLAAYDDGTVYYSSDNDDTSGTTAIDSAGNYNATINGPTTGVTGKLNEAYDYDGSNDRTVAPDAAGDENRSGITIAAWINPDTLSGNPTIVGKEYDLTTRAWVIRSLDASSEWDWTIFVGGSSYSTTTTASHGTGSWVHICTSYDGETSRLYINGNLEDSNTAPSGAFNDNNEEVAIGRRETQADRYFDGKIDEVGIWPYEDPNICNDLYNGGNGTNPYATTTNASNFSITAEDTYDLTLISNFSAQLTNKTDTVNFITTSGTIDTSIPSNTSSLYNVTISSNYSGGYFNRTYNNLNVSTDLVARLHQAEVTFNASNRVSGAAVTDFTASTLSNGGSDSQTATNPQLNVSAATNYTFNFTKPLWYDTKLTGIDITALSQTTQTFQVHDHTLDISISVGLGSASENNFTVDIYSDDYDFHEQLSTTSGNIVANLTDGNYTVWINDSIHTLQSYNISLNNTQNSTSVTLDAYTTNTVNVRFFDEETNELIDNQTVTAYFTGNIESYNRTTTNGTLLLEMINPQDYVVTYNADGYEQRTYSFTLTNRTFNRLELYLINNTQDELILTSVQDSFLDPVANAVIRAQKKNLSGTNYYTVETCTTDNSGECLLHLVLYDTTYRFLIIVDGATVLTSSDQVIKQTTLSFRVNLESDTLEEINNILGVTGSLFYDKTNSNIEFTWNDENSLGVTACLDIDARQGGSTIDYNLSCTTSASGTIILPIDTNLSYTYEATGYVTLDGKNYELDRLTVAGDTLSSGLGINGLFIFGFIVIGIAAFTGLWNPVVGPVIMAASVWFFNYIGFITVGTAAATSLIIGAIMVAYLSRS